MKYLLLLLAIPALVAGSPVSVNIEPSDICPLTKYIDSDFCQKNTTNI